MSGVKRNFVAALATQLTSWALALVSNLFLPGYLAPKQFAQFALVSAVGTAIGSLISQGIGRLLVRDIAREPERAGEFLRAALLLRIPQWLGGIAAGALLATMLGYSRETVMLIVLALGVMLIQHGQTIMVAVLQGLERFHRSNVAQIAEKAGVVAAMVALVILRQPLWTFVAATAIGPSIGLVVNAKSIRRLLASSRENASSSGTRTIVPYLWREGGTLMVGNLFFCLKDPLNQVLMSRFAGAEAGAWFALAYRLIGSSMIVPVALATVTMPRMAKALADGADAFRREVARQFAAVILLTIPISAILVFATVPLLELLHFYPKYAGAVPVLQLWGGALVLWSLSVVGANALIAADGQGQMKRFSLWALAIHPFMSALMVRWMEDTMANGAIGAVMANNLIECFLLANFTLRLPKGKVRLIDPGRLARTVAAAAPASWLLSRIQGKEQLWLVVPALGAYLIACIAFRAIGEAETSLLRGLVGRFRPGARTLRGAGGNG